MAERDELVQLIAVPLAADIHWIALAQLSIRHVCVCSQFVTGHVR